MTFKPLLAEKADLEKLTFPLLASPKLDGIRALTGFGPMVSRNLKPIPNRHIQSVAAAFPKHLDGEILTYTDGKRDDFNTVQSKVMSADGQPDFVFHVFDWFGQTDVAFQHRLTGAGVLIIDDLDIAPIHKALQLVPHTQINHPFHLNEYEEICLAEGWEGVMLRDPNGRYKYGRSTLKEGILLKVKRFEDDEATIVGTVERMHNTNEATKDALGHTVRSTAKDGLVPMGTLGALVCEWRSQDYWTHVGPDKQVVRFEIGTGFDDATRARLWAMRESLIGREVNFKYQGVGSLGAPRFPVYRGLRGDK